MAKVKPINYHAVEWCIDLLNKFLVPKGVYVNCTMRGHKVVDADIQILSGNPIPESFVTVLN